MVCAVIFLSGEAASSGREDNNSFPIAEACSALTSAFTGKLVIGIAVDQPDLSLVVRREVHAVAHLVAQFFEEYGVVHRCGFGGGPGQFAGASAERKSGEIRDPDQVTVGDKDVEQPVRRGGRDACQCGNIFGGGA